jgi:hypothetical protein
MQRLFLALLALAPTTLHAATQIFNDRATFESQNANFVLDDYENPGYVPYQNDAAMNAVLNETRYRPTGFPNGNTIYAPYDDKVYCAGCNGSFGMDFRFTSVSGANGVDTVGFEYYNTIFLPYTAFVTFGDGSTANYSLSSNNTLRYFFGITSDLEVTFIHLGLPNGGTTQAGYYDQNDLLIGELVPEPTTAVLISLGVAGMALRRRGC